MCWSGGIGIRLSAPQAGRDPRSPPGRGRPRQGWGRGGGGAGGVGEASRLWDGAGCPQPRNRPRRRGCGAGGGPLGRSRSAAGSGSSRRASERRRRSQAGVCWREPRATGPGCSRGQRLAGGSAPAPALLALRSSAGRLGWELSQGVPLVTTKWGFREVPIK